MEITVYPRSNKRCFLNGVFQNVVFRGWSGSASAECTQMLENTGVFQAFCVALYGFSSVCSRGENLKNTVWKTPFVTPWSTEPYGSKTWKRGVTRSAPKGRQQMGETGFCKNLQFPAKICGFLRKSATPKSLDLYRASRKSAKICQKNLRKCAFRVRFLPCPVSLLACPE